MVKWDNYGFTVIIRKLKEEYIKAGREVNYDKMEYLAANEDDIKNLEIDEYTIKKWNRGRDKSKTNQNRYKTTKFNGETYYEIHKDKKVKLNDKQYNDMMQKPVY